MNLRRWLPALGVTLVAAGFTWLNRGERAVVDVGFTRFYRAPLTGVVFVAFLAGMLSMLLLSLRHDRRLRAELRARGLLDPAPSGPVITLWNADDAPAEDAAPVPLRFETAPDGGDDGHGGTMREDDDVTRVRPEPYHDARRTMQDETAGPLPPDDRAR